MYNPYQIKEEFEQVEHGKSRIMAIRSAIRQADDNHDLMYQLSFRLDLCHESIYYDDAMDMLIVFPEALALVDQHPNIPTTPDRKAYKNGLDRVLQVYKWVLLCCQDFYQISYDDCLKFFEDFKQRSLSFGYNLKPYYKTMYNFYQTIDKEYSDRCFHEFMKLPKDGNGDCKACDRNLEIGYYLDKDNLEKANQLAVDIENFTLSCGSGNLESWMRLKACYLHYYMKKRDFESAGKYIRQLEKKSATSKKTEYDYRQEYLEYYTYTDIGKALRIYKKNWKEWQTERCPLDDFNNNDVIYKFFLELAKQQKSGTIKLELDNSFPFYSENGVYKIEELKKYYYNKAKEIALKFDQRNGTNYYQKELGEEYGSI